MEGTMHSESHFVVDWLNCGVFGLMLGTARDCAKERGVRLRFNEGSVEEQVELSLVGVKLPGICDDGSAYFGHAPAQHREAPQTALSTISSRRTVNQTTPYGRPTAASLFRELSQPVLSDHYLIDPYEFKEALGPLPESEQPYRIVVHPQVGLVCDVHSHLCHAEVIGLLAGRWDPLKRCLYIQAPFPCAATERLHDLGHTDVELDSEAEVKVRRAVDALGLQVVGWYHSHPTFKPNPSVMDIFNQQQYQHYTRDEASGVEPFVGLIVSTYDPELPSPPAKHQWFTVTEFGLEDAKDTRYMPMRMQTEYLAFDAQAFCGEVEAGVSGFVDDADYCALMGEALEVVGSKGKVERDANAAEAKVEEAKAAEAAAKAAAEAVAAAAAQAEAVAAAEAKAAAEAAEARQQPQRQQPQRQQQRQQQQRRKQQQTQLWPCLSLGRVGAPGVLRRPRNCSASSSIRTSSRTGRCTRRCPPRQRSQRAPRSPKRRVCSRRIRGRPWERRISRRSVKETHAGKRPKRTAGQRRRARRGKR
ncbi:hypothetical protein B484DRAFT_167752 [Ochromonadaceae sp. CCMP2298]|nr:hypothetical protein B484DRAFT_167752 [Ochromonadaceae sp. CCMP2298]